MREAANQNPVAGETAHGALRGCNGINYSTEGHCHAKPSLTVSWGDGEAPTRATFKGREAQTLALLIQYGRRGFTSGEASRLGWARRTSHYVHKLRTAGLIISTTREMADDARIGRYTLQTLVKVIDVEGEQ